MNSARAYTLDQSVLVEDAMVGQLGSLGKQDRCEFNSPQLSLAQLERREITADDYDFLNKLDVPAVRSNEEQEYLKGVFEKCPLVVGDEPADCIICAEAKPLKKMPCCAATVCVSCLDLCLRIVRSFSLDLNHNLLSMLVGSILIGSDCESKGGIGIWPSRYSTPPQRVPDRIITGQSVTIDRAEQTTCIRT